MSGEVKVGGMHWVKDRRDRWISGEVGGALPTEAAMLDEIERLRAEVERLRTAGDVLLVALNAPPLSYPRDSARKLWQEARREQ